MAVGRTTDLGTFGHPCTWRHFRLTSEDLSQGVSGWSATWRRRPSCPCRSRPHRWPGPAGTRRRTPCVRRRGRRRSGPGCRHDPDLASLNALGEVSSRPAGLRVDRGGVPEAAGVTMEIASSRSATGSRHQTGPKISGIWHCLTPRGPREIRQPSRSEPSSRAVLDPIDLKRTGAWLAGIVCRFLWPPCPRGPRPPGPAPGPRRAGRQLHSRRSPARRVAPLERVIVLSGTPETDASTVATFERLSSADDLGDPPHGIAQALDRLVRVDDPDVAAGGVRSPRMHRGDGDVHLVQQHLGEARVVLLDLPLFCSAIEPTASRTGGR
jgi:hypothetical protein